MAKKSKVNVLVAALRSFVDKSDKEVLADLGLIHTIDLSDSMLDKLHQFENAAFELLLVIDKDNVDRFPWRML